MSVPPRYATFWDAFCQTRAVDPTPHFLEAFHFDDNEPSANELAALVIQGRKQATAALVWTHERENKPFPRPGDLSIVTDFAGNAVCVIETIRVDIVPFNEVSADFAATEGEGDGSLEYWRRAHEAFFARECQRIGRPPEHNMPVVCERFSVAFKPQAASEQPGT
jgi:uncharacterized protein YhfF